MPYIGKQPANVPVTADDIPNDSITSAKILDNVITISDIGPNAVGNSEMADDAIGLNELSATGTTNSSTFLRGDNTWAVTPDSTSASDLTSGTLPIARIADDAVTAAKLANSINTDIATGVTGNTTANAALPKAGGAMTGAITTNSTFDGVDIATRDGVLTTTTATAAAALPKAGGTMTGTIVLPTGNSTTGGLNLPTANSWITGSGHGVAQVDATTTYLYGGSGGVQFRTANNASGLVNITNAGKVGIGVAAPAEMLEIYNASSPAIQLNDGGDYKSIFRMAGNDLEIRGSSGSMEFYNGSADGDSSAQRMTIDASGNVGIGTVPKGWVAYEMLQIGDRASFGSANGDEGAYMSQNAYNDGAWKRIETSAANQYTQNGSGHLFKVAANGSANAAISWNTAMTIATNGEITTLGGIASSVAGGYYMIQAAQGNNTYPTYSFQNDGNTGMLRPAADTLGFVTGGSERMRITDAGKVGIGMTPDDAKLQVSGNVFLGDAATDATIDNNLTGGGLDVAVGSGTKAFQVWDDGSTGTPRLSVLRNGTVTMPAQPSFRAYKTAINTGGGLDWNGTYHNVGSHFNVNNGKFTAPVDGVYLIGFHFLSGDNTDQTSVALNLNSSSDNGVRIRSASSGGHETASASHAIYLSANDYILPTFSGSGEVYGSVSKSWTEFSGHLLG